MYKKMLLLMKRYFWLILILLQLLGQLLLKKIKHLPWFC